MQALKSFWRFPWGYPQATVLVCGLFVAGSFIHAVGIEKFPMPPWPFNALSLVALVGVIALLHWRVRATVLGQWLSGIPLSITAMAYVGTLTLLAALIPQAPEPDGIWIHSLVSSWPFALGLLLVLLNLGLATLKRASLQPSTEALRLNWGFLLNHAGLWIVFAAMAFGAPDVAIVKIYVKKGDTVVHGFVPADTKREHPLTMPFALRLKEFTMEEYPSKLTLYPIPEAGAPPATLPEAASLKKGDYLEMIPGQKKVLGNYEIEVLKSHSLSAPIEVDAKTPPRYEPYNGVGAVNSGLVRITDLKAKTVREEWLSPGNTFYPVWPIKLSPTLALVALEPQAKSYRSDLEVLLPEQVHDRSPPKRMSLEVNRPLKIAGWHLYQSSFDSRLGRWSNLSVMDAVQDPWLKLVYLGFFMVLAGVCELMVRGLRRRRV